VKLKELILKDKSLFQGFLNSSRHQLAVYAFENIYIWKALFKIHWALIDQNLCVFLRDKTGCFLYLPPLGKGRSLRAIGASFRIMDSFNANKSISRIENIEEGDLRFYRKLGFKLIDKSCDYLCSRTDLVELRGNKFKSKRASYNYFIKHYPFEYLDFTPKYRRDCLDLYDFWARQKQETSQDKLYQGMIQDSRDCLELLLKDYCSLGLSGKVVKVAERVTALTLGFPINPGTFCVLYEITDLSIKGLAQFIFRQFARDLKGYRYINIMDDSGLGNLKKVKLSYHPVKAVMAYIAQRENV